MGVSCVASDEISLAPLLPFSLSGLLKIVIKNAKHTIQYLASRLHHELLA
jgi:hypothetical protein